MHAPWAVLLVVVAASAGSAAAQDKCSTSVIGTLQISEGEVFSPLPPGTVSLFIFKPGEGRKDPLSKLVGGAWTVSEKDLQLLKAAEDAQITFLEFVNVTGRTVCIGTFNVGTAGNIPPGTANTPPTATTRAYDRAEDCPRAGAAWETEIAMKRRRDKGHFTLLVFLESATGGDANVCYYNRDYGVVGDPIYVGVFRSKLTWTGAKFEPCAIQSAAPNILQSSEKFTSVEHTAGQWTLHDFLPRRCFNTAVDVSVVGDAGGKPVAQRYPLSQYDRYRATLQAGILFTPLHDSEFALRADQTDPSKKFIYDKGPTNRGPEYVASLQLYSIFRYLPSLLGRGTYSGRDPINDQSFLDRIGGILGAGIKNPGKRFVAGLSFEVIYGLSAVGVIDFAKINSLHEEVSITEPFQGAVEDIPTKLVWKHRTTFGLSLDLRYLATLFSGNR